MATAAVTSPLSARRRPRAARAGYGPFHATVGLLLFALALLIGGLELSYVPPAVGVSVPILDREVVVRARTPNTEEAAAPETDDPVAEASGDFAIPEALALLLPPAVLPALIKPASPAPAALPAEPILHAPSVPVRPALAAASEPVLPPPPEVELIQPIAIVLPARAPLPILPGAPVFAAPAAAPLLSPGPAPLPRLAAWPPRPAEAPAGKSETEAGRLARIAPAAAPRAVSAPARPRIAVVLWGLGQSAAASAGAIRRLPGAVTLSLNPAGHDLQRWADRARAAGHEVLLEVPMEPLSYPTVDPGPRALLTSLSEAENARRLEEVLGLVDGYRGVTNFMGSRFTTSEAQLRPVLARLKTRDLAFLDSSASSKSIAYRLAGELGLDRAINNRYIDNEEDAQAIDARLAELETLALRHGAAVGIGSPGEVTLDRLEHWIAGLEAKGLELAPLSRILRKGAGG